MSKPRVPRPPSPPEWLRILREAIARLNEIAEDEVDSHLAWQAHKVVQRLEQRYEQRQRKEA